MALPSMTPHGTMLPKAIPCQSWLGTYGASFDKGYTKNGNIGYLQVIAGHSKLPRTITSDNLYEFVNPMYVNTFATFATWEI